VVPLKRRLQSFQIELLHADYADFARQPRFAALVDFFFGAVYAPQDFGLRNDSFQSLHDWLRGVVGPEPVRVLGNAIELYDLTESLDDDMVLALRSLAAEVVLDRPAWERAYGRVGRPLDRQRQMELLVNSGAVMEIAARVPLVYWQLRAVRPAAGLLGWAHVIDFLLEGQVALTQAHPIRPLLEAIIERETLRMERLLPAVPG
jgi:hypothetical protein